VDDGLVSPALTRASLQRAAGIAGTVLCLIAAAFLLKRGIALGAALGDRLAQISPIALAEALILYVAGALLLGVAWVVLVRATSNSRARLRPLFIAHLRSQIAKYLPGNVFHFAYRHVAARREGVAHAALGSALGFESALLIVAAAVLALGVASDPRLDQLVPWAHRLVWIAPMVAAIACVGIIVGARRFASVQVPVRTVACSLFGALAIDLIFFLLAACALRLLCAQPDALPFGAWCGWLALAWIVGYVVPGAPAGLGLREAVVVLGLKPVLGDAEALAVALCYRLVTVSADALLAGAGFAARRDAS
jgi:hypothetical protein